MPLFAARWLLAGCLLAGAIPAAAQVRLEPGGSNYIAFRVPQVYLNGCPCDPPYDNRNPKWVEWARTLFVPGAFGHTIGDYHLDPELVRTHLEQMYASGQRKIGLLVHLMRSVSECMDLSDPAPDVCHTTHRYDGQDGAWAFVLPLDTVTSQLLPQHQQNLKHLIADLRRIGYNQVHMRFAPFGELDPRGWRNGAEAPWNYYHTFLYEKYWTAVRTTVDSINAWVPDGDSVAVIYDLNAEMANYIIEGDGKPWNSAYSFGHTGEHMRRIWRDYLKAFGNTRTIGFTFGNRALNPGVTDWRRDVIAVVNRLVYDSVGQRPKGYAFDIYANAPGAFSGLTRCKAPCYKKFFEELARQARAEKDPPQILVWESTYNDKKFADAVRYANRKLKLGIPYVMQWASWANPWTAHFLVVPPVAYDRYLPLSR